jgi:hypothetical protein
MTWRRRFGSSAPFNRLSDWESNPLYTEIVSPAQYMKFLATMPKAIRSARFIPPKLGYEGFGKVLIVWKSPVIVVRGFRQGLNEQPTY